MTVPDYPLRTAVRLCRRKISDSFYTYQSLSDKNAVKIQMITRQFIAAISEELEVNLNNDYEFFENLSNHLNSVFSAPPAAYPERDVIEEVLEENPVEFVCCLSAVDHKTHLKAFFNLVNMLQNDEFKELLRQCKTPAEAASIIEKYEYTSMG